jgi:hypothetical protein
VITEQANKGSHKSLNSSTSDPHSEDVFNGYSAISSLSILSQPPPVVKLCQFYAKMHAKDYIDINGLKSMKPDAVNIIR